MAKRNIADAFDDGDNDMIYTQVVGDVPIDSVAVEEPVGKRIKSVYKKDYGGMRSDRVVVKSKVEAPSKHKPNRQKKKTPTISTREVAQEAQMSPRTAEAERKAREAAEKRAQIKRSYDKYWVKREQKEQSMRKRNKKNVFGKVPVEVFNVMCLDLYPLDLLHLARICKGTRSMIMTNQSAKWWEICRANIAMPACPPEIGLSEPAYISFVFENQCMAEGCEHKVHCKDYNFCRRYCKPCLPRSFITREEAKIWTENRMPQHILYKCYYVSHKSTRVKKPGTSWVVLKDYVMKKAAEWAQIPRKNIPEQREFAKRLDEERAIIKSFGDKLSKWETAYNQGRHDAILARGEEIIAKLIEKNGHKRWKKNDMPILYPEWKRLVEKEETLTAYEWSSIVHPLENLVSLHLLNAAARRCPWRLIKDERWVSKKGVQTDPISEVRSTQGEDDHCPQSFARVDPEAVGKERQPSTHATDNLESTGRVQEKPRNGRQMASCGVQVGLSDLLVPLAVPPNMSNASTATLPTQPASLSQLVLPSFHPSNSSPATSTPSLSPDGGSPSTDGAPECVKDHRMEVDDYSVKPVDSTIGTRGFSDPCLTAVSGQNHVVLAPPSGVNQYIWDAVYNEGAALGTVDESRRWAEKAPADQASGSA